MSNRTTTLARLLLGLVFVVFGFDGVLHVLPLPPMPERAHAVLEVLMGYRLFYAVKAIEVVSGALLLANRHVRAALVLLGPVLFNIAWFDAALDPQSLPVALVLVALHLRLVWTQRATFAPLLAA